MQVTNALASKYISENLELRETQVKGTTAFLGDELESVRKRLMDKEEELKAYRERYMGGLPEQLNRQSGHAPKASITGRPTQQGSIGSENRKFLTQQNLEECRKGGRRRTLSTGRGWEVKDLPFLKSELVDLEASYTAQHPDVVRLKKVIETLEA